MSLNKTISVFNKIANDPTFSYLKKMADHIDLVAHVAVRNVCTEKEQNINVPKNTFADRNISWKPYAKIYV